LSIITSLNRNASSIGIATSNEGRGSEHQSGMRHIPQSIPLVLTKLWETQIFMQEAIFSAQQNIGKAIRRSTKAKKLSTPLSNNAFGCFCLKALRRP
jgi:hypothetical protein